MTWIGRIFIAIDQLGNALAGGNPDVTISQRLGYLFAYRRMKWTTFLMRVVDFTFYAVDGKRHCLTSYLNDEERSETKYKRGNDIALAILGVIVVPSCVLLVVPVWIYSLITKERY